jgi:hypothetical protein
LFEHIKSKPECLEKDKKKIGMTPKHLPKPPPTRATARVSFRDHNDVFEISPRNKRVREATIADQNINKEGEDEATKLQRIVQEDYLARVQISGQLDKMGSPKAQNLELDMLDPDHDHEDNMGDPPNDQEDDAKMPAQEAEVETVDEDSEDEYEDDFAHYEGQEEIHHLMYGGGEDQHPVELDAEQLAAIEAIANPDYNNDRQINQHPNTKMRDEFREYCANGKKNFRSLTIIEVRSIKLLHTLKEKKAPLDTYDKIMDWHHRENGDIKAYQDLGNVQGYLSFRCRVEVLVGSLAWVSSSDESGW